MKKLCSLILSLAILLNTISVNSFVFAEETTGNRLEVQGVYASEDDGNEPINTIDNYSDTRWSAKNDEDADGDGVNDGQWIHFDLGEEKSLGYVGLAFYKGDERYTTIDIDVSTDNENWTTVYSGHSEEATTDMIKFDIEDTTVRYIKITGYQYVKYASGDTGEWISLTEVHFYSNDTDAMDVMEEAEVADTSITYSEPGLVDSDGTEHEEHTDNPVTGTTYEVTSNGSDDSSTIQELIDEASFGDEIYFPDGMYYISTPLGLLSGINLRGESQSGTILLAIPDSDGDYEDEVIESYGQNDIVISDLTITSEFTGEYSTDHKVNNPDASGPKYPIRIEDSASRNLPSYNITVDNVLVENFQTMAVRISSSHDVTVKNSTFKNATDVGGGGAGYGVSIQGDGNNIDRLGYSNDSRFNIVEDCTFEGPYLRHGVILQYYTHSNEIRDNVLTETKLDAIDLHGEDEYLNEIYDNVITDIETGAGIAAGNTGATHDASGAGNYIHDNMITNCREGIKIHLGTENTIIENNTITGSTVDNAKGIYLQNAPGTVVKNNTVIDNISDDFYAVYVNYDAGTDGRGSGIPENIVIEDNVFANCSNGTYISEGMNIGFNNNVYTDIIGNEVNDLRIYDYAGDLLPSDVLDLTNWKITLPINSAEEIKQPDLASYEHEDYFHVNDTNDGVVFNAPCDADETDGTTTNSSYPRSELREMTNNGENRISWETNNGTHTMIIDEMITSTPVVKPDVVVGQIHDVDDDVIMIRLEGNELFVQAEGEDLGILDENYQLGTRFEVKIVAENDMIDIYYNNELKVEYSVHKEGCYFKAGMYTQSNPSKGDEADAYGEVEIFSVSATHEGYTGDLLGGTNTSTDTAVAVTTRGIPVTDPVATLDTVMDTFIEIEKGVPNEVAENENSQLEIKTSSKEDYNRMTFIEFDKSSYTGTIQAAQLEVSKKSCDGDLTVAVYATTEMFDSSLVWTNFFTGESRISYEGNTDVADWLATNATKVGNMTFDNSDKTAYTLNVSDYVNDSLVDKFTFIIIDENGANLYLKLESSDGGTAPKLSVWDTYAEVSDGDVASSAVEAVSDVSEPISSVETNASKDIPLADGDVVVNPSVDNIIELSSKVPTDDVDGTLLNKDTLYVKTSSGETTIRLGFLKFDISEVADSIAASQLYLTTASASDNTAISVYGTLYDGSTLNWTDIFTADARFTKNDNTDIPTWLAVNATKIGEINVANDGFEYTLNVSDYVNDNLGSDVFTIILVNEVKDNSNTKFNSNDKSTEEFRPKLSVWYPASVEAAIASGNTVGSNDILAEEETSADANDVDSALGLVTYNTLEITAKSVNLPTTIGDDVTVTWSSGNNDVIANDGVITTQGNDVDVTLTATFSKNSEVTTKEFIVVIEGNGIVSEDETVSFVDISSVEWASEAIETLASKGMISGVSDTEFAPNDNITREVFIKLLISALDLVDETAVSNFSDVSEEAWYYEYVASAQSLGITTGYEDGSFGIGKEITREEMATIAYRASIIANISFDTAVDGTIFADDSEIESYANDAIYTLQSSGVINGVGENSFEPKSMSTRAQTAVMIYKLFNLAE